MTLITDPELYVTAEEADAWLLKRDDGWREKRVVRKGIRTVLEGRNTSHTWIEVACVKEKAACDHVYTRKHLYQTHAYCEKCGRQRPNERER